MAVLGMLTLQYFMTNPMLVELNVVLSAPAIHQHITHRNVIKIFAE